MRFSPKFSILVLAAVTLLGARARSEPYPTGPITIVVPYSPGVTDQQMRVIAPVMQRLSGQTVVIENRAGAGGAIGARFVAAAKPDGYTLLYAAPAVITVLPVMQATPYATGDLLPVARVTSNPHVLAIRANAPFSTLPEMIAYGRANPGKIRFGSSGTGTAVHLAGEAFARAGGFKIKHIPFKGLNEAITQVLGGDIDFVVGLPVAILPLVKDGKMKALAQFGATRSPLAPDVPTLREQGVDLSLAVDIGLFGPKDLSAERVGQIDALLAAAMKSPEVDAYVRSGVATVDYLDAAGYGKLVDADRQLEGSLLTELGLKQK